MLPVNALRWAENRISAVSSPTNAMTAPTTSSLRSSVRALHQLMETGSGGRGAAAFFFGAGAAFSFPPLEGDSALPAGFSFDLGVGVLRGILRCRCEGDSPSNLRLMRDY